MKKKSYNTFHRIYLNSIRDFDRKAIDRFISDAMNRRPIDGNDAMEIALLLLALTSGAAKNFNITATLRKAMGMTRTRAHKLGSDAVRLGGVAWNIVERKVKGEITRAEGIREFGKLNDEVDVRTLERWFDALVPEVEEHLESLRILLEAPWDK
jgi:hypothetical protein